MFHRIYGRKLNRTIDERNRLFKNLARSLFIHGKITTTFAKAKAIQPYVEKLITKAKANSLASRRILIQEFVDKELVDRILTVVGPAFKNRQGGYTRIIKKVSRTTNTPKNALMAFTEKVTAGENKTASKMKEKKLASKAKATTPVKEKYAKDSGHKTK